MAGTQPIEREQAQPGDHAPERSSSIVRRPGWQMPLPIFNEQLETFQFVEWIIIITAYLFHFVEAPSRDWSHWLAWTTALGGFVLIERFEPWFIARGRAGLYIALRLACATWAIWLVEVGFITTFLFFIVVANGWAIERRLGIVAAIGSAVAIYGTMFLLVGFSEPEEYINLLPWAARASWPNASRRLANAPMRCWSS